VGGKVLTYFAKDVAVSGQDDWPTRHILPPFGGVNHQGIVEWLC